MFNTHKVEIEWGGRPLILETGKVARQADGAVIATYGETMVLAGDKHSTRCHFLYRMVSTMVASFHFHGLTTYCQA